MQSWVNPFKVTYSSQPPIWVLLWLSTLFLLCSLHILKWRLLLPGAQRDWKSICIWDRTWASIPSSRTNCKTSLEESCRIKSKTLLPYEEVCIWKTLPATQHSVVSGWADYLPFSGKCLTSTDCRLSTLNAVSSKSTHHTVLDLSWRLAHERVHARLNTKDLLLGCRMDIVFHCFFQSKRNRMDTPYPETLGFRRFRIWVFLKLLCYLHVDNSFWVGLKSKRRLTEHIHIVT